MKSKAIKSYNLPQDRIVDFRIDAKPYSAIVVLTGIGFCLSIINNLKVTGFALVSLGIFAVFFLPRRILLEFSSDYVVIYNKANHYDCFMIYYNEIINWLYIKKVYSDELCFELKDGSTIIIECFGPRRTERLLNMYAPGKKKKVIRKK